MSEIWIAGRIFHAPAPDPGLLEAQRAKAATGDPAAYWPGRMEILGAFDSREKAFARCDGWGNKPEDWGDWIARLNLNEPLPNEACAWPELYWVNRSRLFDRNGAVVEAA